MIHLNKCENCLNSRTIISETGLHKICRLSDSEATDCITDLVDKKIEIQNSADGDGYGT